MAEQKKLDAPRAPELVEQDARMEQQAQFDPKVHGVGTMPMAAPSSVAEMYKVHKDFVQEVEDAFHSMTLPATGVINSLMSRMDELERKMQSMMYGQSAKTPAPVAAPGPAPAPAAEPEAAPAPSPFKKKESIQ